MDLFIKICSKYDLGQLIAAPVVLTGGFMHKMYGITTIKGRYAIKLLNPHIMRRENAKENYRIAEDLELILEQRRIPILPAMIFNSKKMQEIDGQFFYIFEWYDGRALHGKDIQKSHCAKIGKVLAEIHNIDMKKEVYQREEIHVDWHFYLEQLKDENREIYRLLNDNLSLLYESQEKGNAAIKKLPPIVTICHSDMDTKNVLWKGEDYRIIDLECLTYASPFIEMYELALCWSGYEECDIDFHLFNTFLESYFSEGGLIPTDWETIYYSNFGRLEWLEYNLKRVLGIESEKSEKELGISETIATLEHVVYYEKMKNQIFKCLSWSICANFCKYI